MCLWVVSSMLVKACFEFIRVTFRISRGLFSCSEKACFEFIRGTFRIYLGFFSYSEKVCFVYRINIFCI